MQSLPVLTVVGRQSVTGMNPPSVHGVMLTVCSIRAMFTANVRELNVITVASSKSQHLLNGRTAAIPITNAVCEGINSMIQAAKRKAREYNTFEGFAAMIYLVAGKLELPVPDPF